MIGSYIVDILSKDNNIYGGNQFDDFDNITVDKSGNVVDTNKYTDKLLPKKLD